MTPTGMQILMAIIASIIITFLLVIVFIGILIGLLFLTAPGIELPAIEDLEE